MSVNTQKRKRKTEGKLIHEIIRNQNKTAFCAIISEEKNLQKKDSDLNRPLHIAAEVKDAFFALQLLEKNVDVNIFNRHGDSPLILAIKSGNRCVFNELLNKGADVNLCDAFNDTPLITAIKCHRGYEFRTLVNKGADITRTGCYANSPLHVAVIVANNYAFDMLMKKKVTTLVVNDIFHDPLHYAIKYFNNHAFKGLLPLGLISCNHLQTAVKYKNYFALRKLLKHDSETKEESLRAAVVMNDLEMIAMLVKYGVDINQSEYNEGTPLQMAIKSHNKKAYNLLIDLGADFNISDKDIQSALTFAVHYSNNDALRDLLRRNIDLNSVHNICALRVAVYSKNIYALDRLLMAGTNIDGVSFGGGYTLLHYALGSRDELEDKEYCVLIIKFGLLQTNDHTDIFGTSTVTDWMATVRDTCLSEIEKMKNTFLCKSNCTIFFFFEEKQRGID